MEEKAHRSFGSTVVAVLTESALEEVRKAEQLEAEAKEIGIDHKKEKARAKEGWVTFQSLFEGNHMPAELVTAHVKTNS